MRLLFLNPMSRALINVRRLRKYGYDTQRIVTQNAETLDKLIVLGNSSPEDEIVGIMSHHLNGVRTVGIVKPETAGIPALDYIREYAIGNVCKILFIIDQDNNSLDQFFQLVRERIGQTGRVQPIEDYEEDERVKMYTCCMFPRPVDIIVVASGSEDIDTPSHEIEDHLLVTAGIVSEVNDSKEYWRSLDESEREDVIRLLKDRDLFEISFRQHVCGCGYLER
jgi:hypothetical protein